MSETDVSGSPEAPNPVPEVPETPAAAPPRPAAKPSSNGPAADDAPRGPDSGPTDGPDTGPADGGTDAARKRRRRGSRGGRKRSKPRAEGATTDGDDAAGDDDETPAGPAGDTTAAASRSGGDRPARSGGGGQGGRGRGRGRTRASGEARTRADRNGDGDGDGDRNPELPDPPGEGRPTSVEAATAALVPKAPSKPKIGDTIPAEVLAQMARKDEDAAEGDGRKRRRRRGGRGRSAGKGQNGGGSTKQASKPVEALIAHDPTELDEETLERRRGRERKGRAVGRYSMCVHVTPRATQIAVLEGRSLIEHYVSHPSDDISQIHGNVYLGRVQNVLPGMEAAFVDIGTPKNAVLYRGDVHYDPEDVERSSSGRPRIEDVLRAGQTILCQVTKNPIGAKGARLTQEVSLPGRFVVLIPNSSTYGISKRLPDDERKRLRNILDRVKPAQHGVIVRTAAENVTTEEIEDDVRRLLDQWGQIEALAKRSKAPTLLYREPDMAVRVIREEFSQDYRSVLIDDRELHAAVRDYVASISPELADRVEYFDPEAEALPLYERHHVHEQLHRALDRKVWLPSGGSLIIEHTEALTVIDVNTGKNVGRSSLEETVFKNNLEAAVEIARQLRLRDVGGIIVVDFIDMERKDNREEVVRVFRDALSRDKTRTQVFDISELGLCEMTRKRIGEGLLESFAGRCPDCDGRGVVIDKELLPD
ncbi:MAG TPA: Rne/Rng family ribonuclease [Acidimicrobiales bacterium]|nr:Rne/Rng family ribonuclease [Acidimicrobiales bacterium]